MTIYFLKILWIKFYKVKTILIFLEISKMTDKEHKNVEYSISLKDKNIIVTGANTGIGFETALDFAKRGANLILACRNVQLGNEAVEKIKSESKNENVTLEQLDLGSLTNTRAFAERILAKWDCLHILVNNAGLAGVGYKLTDDGFETHFQINYLSHYLLTRLLLDLLKKSAPSRIINVSSIAGSKCKISAFIFVYLYLLNLIVKFEFSR
jgi:NAD(P)-dependent dehydrogenase (short-subunit alcohol dehydrogenase family)